MGNYLNKSYNEELAYWYENNNSKYPKNRGNVYLIQFKNVIVPANEGTRSHYAICVDMGNTTDFVIDGYSLHLETTKNKHSYVKAQHLAVPIENLFSLEYIGFLESPLNIQNSSWSIELFRDAVDIYFKTMSNQKHYRNACQLLIVQLLKYWKLTNYKFNEYQCLQCL
ncbi:hypothetical protein DLAC_00209 [Tieghemostelium lacteum]|uniref:Uncharacterized protein n=1 Tax=Tieghemostelium lacteum TaxID=361077 RepID=A0A152A9E0_TIELA|nr:hypothetical protein DLAC_00209 [Tieghemostelium lacteum]|eukprot:KYR02745.1 hypothetical protein DLAC_00209 [Tieghemostelium lacteum]